MEKHHVEYATYLLKNRHALKRDVEILRMGLDFEKQEIDSQKVNGTESSVDVVYRNVMKRVQKVPHGKVEKMVNTVELELARLDAAVEALERKCKEVIVDLYYHNLSWTQVSMRRYISTNTLNRYRKKGIDAIGKALCGSVLLEEEYSVSKKTG